MSTGPSPSCQLELSVASINDLKIHEPVGQWSRMAPLRIFSIDIETRVLTRLKPGTQKPESPNPTKEPVLQIANLLTVLGDSEPCIRRIFTLRSCEPIDGAHVSCYNDEKNMLREWRSFFQEIDANVLIGYNSSRFDFPYLVLRANNLGQTSVLGRVKAYQSTTTTRTPGWCKWTDTPNIPGRIQIDLFNYIQRHCQPDRGLSLRAVSSQFLGETKEDMALEDINRFQDGSSAERRILAIYCLKDAYLPQRLLDKLGALETAVAVARQEYIPFN